MVQPSSNPNFNADSTAPNARPNWTIDPGWERYSAAEHAVWKTLFDRPTRLLPGRACDEFLRGMHDLPIGPEQRPPTSGTKRTSSTTWNSPTCSTTRSATCR